MLVQYEGTVKQLIYSNNDYLIALFETEKQIIKIIGNMFGIEPKEKLLIKGIWKQHQRYGKQLEVTEWKRPTPKSEDEAIEILSSGIIKGVGKARAKLIVKTLGDQAISIISKDGEKALSGIKGIGKKTAKDIAES